MVNPAWGKKRVCTGCSARYYDMRNPAPVCPKCGTAVDMQMMLRPRKRVIETISSADLGALPEVDLIADEQVDALDTTALDEDVLGDDELDDDLSTLAPVHTDDV